MSGQNDEQFPGALLRGSFFEKSCGSLQKRSIFDESGLKALLLFYTFSKNDFGH